MRTPMGIGALGGAVALLVSSGCDQSSPRSRDWDSDPDRRGASRSSARGAYGVAIPMAFVHQWISDALYVAVALLWLAPDRRIEARLEQLER